MTLETITGLTTANTTYTLSPSGWTNGNITATASSALAVNGLTIQTSKDAKKWDDSPSQSFSANGTMYARLTDGKNTAGYSSNSNTFRWK